MGQGSQMHGKQFYFPSLQNSTAFDSCQNNGTPLRLQPFGVNDFSSAAEPIIDFLSAALIKGREFGGATPE